MASSAFLGIFWSLAPAPIPDPGALEFGRIALAEGLAPVPNGSNNAREWRAVPKRDRRRTGRLASN
jgi:hypothetical protein